MLTIVHEGHLSPICPLSYNYTIIVTGALRAEKVELSAQAKKHQASVIFKEKSIENCKKEVIIELQLYITACLEIVLNLILLFN